MVYQKTTAEDEAFDASSSAKESGKKMKMRFEGSAPLTKDRKAVVARNAVL